MNDRPAFDAILAARLSRRTFFAASAVGLAACARIPTYANDGGAPNAFRSIAPQDNDVFTIAGGYRWNLIARWGDSLVTGTPDFDTRRMTDNRWADAAAVDAQHRQFGTNADAVQYFPLAPGRKARGLVCVNHEYFSGELVFHAHRGAGMKADDRRRWMEQHPHAVAFMQAAHGVTVMELGREAGGWTRNPSSPSNRRITARTPMEISGPARGHGLMRTKADPAGERVLGTFANCAAGKTPWGTYLTSEENVDDYFAGGRTHRETAGDAAANDGNRRFPLREDSFYGWEVQDPRFDMRSEPHEPFRFGWMVEIDPHDPKSVPRKRTALGRFQHEGANTIVGRTGHVAAYMGDDEKFEYVLQVRHARPLRPEESGRQPRPARSRHVVRRALQRGRHGLVAAAGPRREGPTQLARRLREPGRRRHQGTRRRGPVGRNADGPSRGRGTEPGQRPCLHRLHEDHGTRSTRHHEPVVRARSGCRRPMQPTRA